MPSHLTVTPTHSPEDGKMERCYSQKYISKELHFFSKFKFVNIDVDACHDVMEEMLALDYNAKVVAV